jgi:hypothetical protein
MVVRIYRLLQYVAFFLYTSASGEYAAIIFMNSEDEGSISSKYLVQPEYFMLQQLRRLHSEGEIVFALN